MAFSALYNIAKRIATLSFLIIILLLLYSCTSRTHYEDKSGGNNANIFEDSFITIQRSTEVLSEEASKNYYSEVLFSLPNQFQEFPFTYMGRVITSRASMTNIFTAHSGDNGRRKNGSYKRRLDRTAACRRNCMSISVEGLPEI